MIDNRQIQVQRQFNCWCSSGCYTSPHARSHVFWWDANIYPGGFCVSFRAEATEEGAKLNEAAVFAKGNHFLNGAVKYRGPSLLAWVPAHAVSSAADWPDPSPASKTDTQRTPAISELAAGKPVRTSLGYSLHLHCLERVHTARQAGA